MNIETVSPESIMFCYAADVLCFKLPINHICVLTALWFFQGWHSLTVIAKTPKNEGTVIVNYIYLCASDNNVEPVETSRSNFDLLSPGGVQLACCEQEVKGQTEMVYRCKNKGWGELFGSTFHMLFPRQRGWPSRAIHVYMAPLPFNCNEWG